MTNKIKIFIITTYLSEGILNELSKEEEKLCTKAKLF